MIATVRITLIVPPIPVLQWMRMQEQMDVYSLSKMLSVMTDSPAPLIIVAQMDVLMSSITLLAMMELPALKTPVILWLMVRIPMDV